jgi:hypothetical protein
MKLKLFIILIILPCLFVIMFLGGLSYYITFNSNEFIIKKIINDLINVEIKNRE